MTKNHLPRIIFSVIIGAVILFAGLKVYGILAGMAEAPPKKEVRKRIKEVEVLTVRNGNLRSPLEIQGRLQAYNKVDLFTEVGGRVIETGKPFKEGSYFGKGQVLLRIDNAEARLALQSQKATLMNAIAGIMPDLKIDYPESFATWDDYLRRFDVDAPLPELPTAKNDREKLFVAGRNLYSQYYQIKSVEDRLAKYTLYAPFSGTLTAALVDKGAVIRPGQNLGTLMATGYYEMVATVPLSQLRYLQPGGKVSVYSEDIAGRWDGKVSRVSDQIDAGSQTVDVYIGVSGKGLREGMYLRGEAQAITLDNVVELDRNLLIEDRSVYAVENDTSLVLLPVTVEKFNRETAILRGIPDGTKVLISDVAGPYEGMRVKIAGEGEEVSVSR